MMSASLSGVDAFDALVFGTPNQQNLEYFNKQHESFIQNAQTFVGNLGNHFIQTASNIYNNYVSPIAVERIKQVLRMANDDDMIEAIVPILDYDELIKASLYMQRWVMANPNIRELYHEQRIDGYADTYLDMEPNSVGIAHYDYRMATEAMVEDVHDENGNLDGLVYHQYFVESELRGTDSPLSLSEKIDIKDTWSYVNALLIKGEEDPTSPTGSYM